MKKSKILKTLIGGVLAVSMVLPLGISALADEVDTRATKDKSLRPVISSGMKKGGSRQQKEFRPYSAERQAEFEIILEELVADGTLTSSKVDEVKIFFEENKGTRVNIHNEIVNQGILTQEQIDAIGEKLHEKKAAEKHAKMQASLDSLVESDIINENEASDILDFIDEKAEERKEERDKFKNMTSEEKKEYFKENRPGNKDKKGDLWNELVEEGIIEEAQADSIQEKLHEEKTAERQEKMQEQLDSLVEKGTLTEENVSDILDFIDDKAEERKEERDKIKNMTEEEKKAYFKENKPERGSLAKELVEAGIITEDQANELSELFPKHDRNSEGMNIKRMKR
jgi:DNA polymerase IIIc chi subunit